MIKLFIIKNKYESTWESCKTISSHLEDTYRLLPPIEFQKTFYLIESNHSIDHLLNEIIATMPDRLVFIDHAPSPSSILLALSQLTDLTKLPPILIHSYGDFTYYANEWSKLNDKIINHPIEFINASLAQNNLMKFFLNDSTQCEPLFFPLDQSEFYFNQNEREVSRTKYFLTESDFVLIYTGRISLQKNIEYLITEFDKISFSSSMNFHLWLVGGIDDLGAPFMGARTNEGYLFNKLTKLIENLHSPYKKNIKFFGHQNKDEMRLLYQASDLYISASLYHDEDFGMSPAEALSTGLPSLLSEWGGYSSFESSDETKKWECNLIPVQLTNDGLKIKSNIFRNNLFQKFSDSDREKNAESFNNFFSKEKMATVLERKLSKQIKPFAGFNANLDQYQILFHGADHYLTKISNDAIPTCETFYGKVYQNYISPKNIVYDEYDYSPLWVSDYLSCLKKESPTNESTIPFSNELFSEVNFTQLFQNKIMAGSFLNLDSKSIKWALRDGEITLKDFFNTNEYKKNDFIIHRRFLKLVPSEYQNKISYYDITLNSISQNSSHIEKVFVTGLMKTENINKSIIEKVIEELLIDLKKTSKVFPQVFIYFPENQIQLSQTVNQILNIFKIYPQVLTWREFRSIKNFKNSTYLEFNDHQTLTETFSKHFTLSRGANLCEHNKLIDNVELTKLSTIPLSLYHQVNIYKYE